MSKQPTNKPMTKDEKQVSLNSEIVTQLSQEEVERFTILKVEQEAFKPMMDTAMRSLRELLRENMIERQEFWSALFKKYRISPEGKNLYINIDDNTLCNAIDPIEEAAKFVNPQ
jgi:DNA-binding HxlR family transcriptional regulator